VRGQMASEGVQAVAPRPGVLGRLEALLQMAARLGALGQHPEQPVRLGRHAPALRRLRRGERLPRQDDGLLPGSSPRSLRYLVEKCAGDAVACGGLAERIVLRLRDLDRPLEALARLR